MTAYRTHRQHATDWTPEQDDVLLTYAGQRKLATIAKKLGRTPHAVKRRLWLHGQYLRPTATRRAGMSIKDVAEALGVTKNHVWKWINIGWLKSIPAYGVQRRYVSIDPDAVLGFLRERGALLPNMTPDRDWADEVADAKATLLARFIAGADLAPILCLHKSSLYYIKTRKGFPGPALRLGGCLPDYYDRATVRAWLEIHPSYWTADAKEAL